MDACFWREIVAEEQEPDEDEDGEDELAVIAFSQRRPEFWPSHLLSSVRLLVSNQD